MVAPSNGISACVDAVPLVAPRAIQCESSKLPESSGADLARAWQQVVSAHSRIGAIYSTRDRHFLELVPVRAGPFGKAQNGERLSMLERAFEGLAQKVVASEFQLSLSTVSASMRRLLAALGVECEPRRMPILPILMHHAWLLGMGCGDAACTPPLRAVVSVSRPDRLIARQLSAAEYDVMRAIVDGMTYAQISLARSVSTRTIANQIASAYRKLGISGRGALLALLVQGFCSPNSTCAPSSLSFGQVREIAS